MLTWIQRARLAFQHDGEKMTLPKEVLNMSAEEMDKHTEQLQSLSKEAALMIVKAQQTFQAAQAAQAAQSNASAPPSTAASQPPQPTPLNQVNLEENSRVQKQMHNRSTSKGGQPPAAPTSTQPPFPLHAASPHGQPAYHGRPSVTRDTLQPPPVKKRKTDGPQAATPAAQLGQVKPASPDVKRQVVQEPKAPPKPSIVCPEADCEMSKTGFSTEEARKAHMEEEHIRPYADPVKFASENLALGLGLDSSGHLPPAPGRTPSLGSAGASVMSASLSKQGIGPSMKAEPVGTPMSRADSMKRQASAARAAEAGKGTPGRNTPATRVEATPKMAEAEVPASAATFDPWEGTTIDPQELSATFGFGGESSAQGAITDFSVYRNAFTPNDTPESKEDSGASEPNSDISDGAMLDIDLSVWMADDSTLLEEMNNFTVKPMEEHEAADFAQAFMADPNSMLDVDGDLTAFFDKQHVELDPAFYSMDTA